MLCSVILPEKGVFGEKLLLLIMTFLPTFIAYNLPRSIPRRGCEARPAQQLPCILLTIHPAVKMVITQKAENKFSISFSSIHIELNYVGIC